MSDWVDGDRHRIIDRAMSDAWGAMDEAYHHSLTDADLIRNTNRVSKALAEVRRNARANRHT